MTIRTVRPGERDRLVALVESGLRRPGSPTGPADDFPLALAAANGDWQFVVEEDGEFHAALACLVRTCATSAGDLPVAAIGSVVTAAARQGHGLSRRLQEAVLARLREAGVPLAVLWTDRPELYRARGFAPAGLEFHVDLDGWRGQGAPPGAVVRPYAARDAATVAALHARHPYRTRRAPGDDALLYGMPGTRGWLLEPSAGAPPTAYAFCGKGQDFPGWILEWGGARPAVTALVGQLRKQERARWLLAPQGTEELAAGLAAAGAGVAARASGLWCVTDAARLAALTGVAAEAADAGAWLGGVDASGGARPGPLRLAVWGFDSV
ncbi:MAG: GNAT family N-acetyltransferase [Candidatus Krumholzibacteriia bacterium]